MNRRERRAQKHENHALVGKLPEKLTLIPPEEFPPNISPLPAKAWQSRKYLVQLYHEDSADYPGLIRLSVNRSKLGKSSWQDGISWEELQAIKRELGYGNWYGVEVYPPDQHIVNISNMRHLWLLPTPLKIGWLGR